MEAKKGMLVILDGWGIGKDREKSAIDKASTPYMDRLFLTCPNARLTTFGTQVGLPVGQMGNSEVGHLNIGAGRIVHQDLAKINNAIKDGSLAKNRVLNDTISYCIKGDHKLHLIGLVSDGGVHSHIEHIKALVDIVEASQLSKAYVHAFTDGRDTDPKGGSRYLKDLNAHLEPSCVELASVVGRYYAMDRDRRWERIKVTYDLLVHGAGTITNDVITSIETQYGEGTTDEFIQPMAVVGRNGKFNRIEDGDAVLFFNFRTDRPRQLTEVLTQFPHLDMKPMKLHYITMTEYDHSFNNVNAMFTKKSLQNTLGEWLAQKGLSQLRAAETEKYPHVTYFFSGGIEEPFEGEKRLMVNSPKVATYDLQPEMSARELSQKVGIHINQESPDFVCINFANTDMVGHTGVFSAAIQAAEAVDACLSDLMEIAQNNDYAVVIIADHGNSDYMINDDGSPNTAHSVNLVPIIVVQDGIEGISLHDGILADVAPTILDLMSLDLPIEMTGTSLIKRS